MGCALLICPPATSLTTVGSVLTGSGIALGGQDCHAAPRGAYTGDISPEMLADMGCSHVILGHSERRHGDGEGDTMVREKIVGAWRAGLVAILCVGETQSQRQAGKAVWTSRNTCSTCTERMLPGTALSQAHHARKASRFPSSASPMRRGDGSLFRRALLGA
jgi:triosephosphate isomerase